MTGYQDAREVSNATLNRIYVAMLEFFHSEVRPYRRPAHVGFTNDVPNPPDFLPEFSPGGYMIPASMYTVLNAWFKDPNSNHDWTLIRLLDESKWEFAPKQSDLAAGAAAGVVYGFIYDRVMYVKGIPDIATSPPRVRIFGSRGPNIPSLNSSGEFDALGLNSQIDAPPQYHERFQYYGIAKVRMIHGDTEDHERYLGMWNQFIGAAKLEFEDDGVENALPCIRVDEDMGGYSQDTIAGTRW